MATPIAFDILGRDKASGALDKVAKKADETGRKFGFLAARSHGLTAGMSAGFGKIVAAMGAVAAVSVFKDFVGEAREARKVGALTEAVIKSTGGAARISADGVGKLAEALSNKVGVDDEAIQSGANLLLTFTNIRNQVGKGNDIFNQATSTITDMTAALNGGAVTQEGMKASSIQLGKALNDPIKGVTALSKVGVSFTAQQKEQIKTLVASGDTLGAQKIILGELQKEFGGAAAAATDPMQKLGVVVGNLKERIGTALLPIVDKAGTWLGTVLPVAIDKAGMFFRDRLQPPLTQFAGFVQTDVLPRLQDLGGFLVDKVVPALEKMASFVSRNSDFFKPFVGFIIAIIAAVKVWTVVQGILNAVLTANPIGLVIVAIAALAAGLIYAYKHSETFRKIVDGAFKIVGAAGKVMWEVILKPLLSAFGAVLKWAWEQAQNWGKVVSGAFNVVKEPAKAALKFVADRMLDFVGTMLDAAAKAFGWVPGVGDQLKNAAKHFGEFRDTVNRTLNGITDQSVNIGIKYTSSGVNLSTPSSVGRRARGGSIFGPGSETSDSIPTLLSNNEHVWSAREVRGAGGHSVLERMRAMARKGLLPALAQGGRPGMSIGIGGTDTRGLAKAVGSSVVAMATSVAKQLARTGGGLAGTMAFGRSQAGKPYVWGGVGPNGYDCSGFVSALINYSKGRNPYRRLGATGSMPWGDMASGAGRFMVGWFKGNPGHTAATINGTNFESRGGDGVVVGGRARGAGHPLFRNRMRVKGFATGGRIGDPPFDRGKFLVKPEILKAISGRRGRVDPMLSAFRAMGYRTESDWNSHSLEYLNILQDLTERRGFPKGLPVLKRALRLHGYRKMEADWGLGSIEMNEMLRDFISRRRGGMRKFAHGGVIAEHVLGVGLRSGRAYQFGEREAERVTPMSRLRMPGRGADMNVYVTITGQVVDPIGTAQKIEELLARLKKTRRGRLAFVDA